MVFILFFLSEIKFIINNYKKLKKIKKIKNKIILFIIKNITYRYILKVFNLNIVFWWINDSKLSVQKNDHGLIGNLYWGLEDFQEMSFMLHYLREDDNFFDVGSNLGAYTILASSVIKCKSYAFEPLPETFERLIKEIKINKIEHLVELHNLGISSKSEWLYFTSNLGCMNRVNNDKYNKNKNLKKIKVIALDEKFNPDKNTLIKIDVEGYEKYILDGGKDFFSNKNVKVLIIEINGLSKYYGIEDYMIDKQIREFGFKPIIYNPINRQIDNIKIIKPGNTIYIKDFKEASIRCKEAKKFKISTLDNFII